MTILQAPWRFSVTPLRLWLGRKRLLCSWQGNTARVGDVLVTRLKALEAAAKEGSWTLAQEFEAVPREDFGLASEGERHHAAALQLRKTKLLGHLAAVQGARR